MTMAEDHDRAALTSRASTIRAQLKQWERAFTTAHNGRKATRDEVKADVEIAPLYKEYHGIRDVLDGKVPAPKKDTLPEPVRDINNSEKVMSAHAQSRKRRRPPASSSDALHSPSKRRQASTNTATPRRPSRFHEHLSSTPDSAKENRTPASARRRAFVGPTPQKDGLVLGLFDLLPADDGGNGAPDGTPSKNRDRKIDPVRAVLGDVTSDHVVFSTPGKRTHGRDVALPELDQTATVAGPAVTTAAAGLNTPSSNRRRHIRTPQSAGRRFLLDSFVTPSKRARGGTNSHTIASANLTAENAASENAAHTEAPASNSKIFGFSTPAFLRRDSSRLAPVAEIYDEEGEEDHENEGEDDENANATARSTHAHNATKSPSRRIQTQKPGLVRNKPQKQKHPWLKPPSFKFSTSFSSSFSGFGFGGASAKSKANSGKSLSAMIGDLRRAEDERLDEEMDLLREMEEGGDSGEGATVARERGEKVFVSESQQDGGEEMEGALGPDGAVDPDADDELVDDAGKQPPRVWKKKGQKRQTRRVILKPKGPSAKATINATDAGGSEDEVVNGGNKDVVVAETQLADDVVSDASEDSYEARSAEEDDETEGVKVASTGRKRKRAVSAATTDIGTQAAESTVEHSDKSRISKAARKISATAHANYRRLKIRSKGGSGKGRGRFGRR